MIIIYQLCGKEKEIVCFVMMLNARCVVYLLLEMHSDMDNMDVERPYVFVLISSVLTWARTKPVDPVTSCS